MKKFATRKLAFLGTDFSKEREIGKEQKNKRNLSIEQFPLIKKSNNQAVAKGTHNKFEPVPLNAKLLNGTFDAIVIGASYKPGEYQAGMAALKKIRDTSCIPVIFTTLLQPSDDDVREYENSETSFLKSPGIAGLRLMRDCPEAPSIYRKLDAMAFRLTAEEITDRTISAPNNDANLWLPEQNKLRIAGIPIQLTPQQGRFMNALSTHRWVGREKLLSLMSTSAESNIRSVIGAHIAKRIRESMKEAGKDQTASLHPVVSLWGFGLLLNPEMDIKICHDAVQLQPTLPSIHRVDAAASTPNIN